ncbi:MAG: type II CRISPR-associated endonuclease Cas1 [Erysipelotrichaceae bacterium]
MSFRQLLIAKSCHLSVEHNSIKIVQEDHENFIPLEDVSIILIESKESTFTSSFFTSCAKHSIPVMLCGENHIPSSLSISINTHYRPYHVLMLQINQTLDNQVYICESLLKYKLKNQLSVLKLISASDQSIELFDGYIEEIIGKDEINREGTAAKVFFNQLYGNGYVRFAEDPINIRQNYGYSVLAACLSRYFSLYGFNLALGINHCGKTNAMNLVYDFIEPFRPLVDYYLFDSLEYLTDKINVQSKKELVNLLNARVLVDKKLVTVQYAMELLVKSYLRYLEGESKYLDLPTIQLIDFDKLNESV